MEEVAEKKVLVLDMESVKAIRLPRHYYKPLPEIQKSSVKDKKSLPNISRWRQ